MEEKGNSPKSFQKKSSVSWVYPTHPWQVNLPIFKATKGPTMLCCFL